MPKSDLLIKNYSEHTGLPAALEAAGVGVITDTLELPPLGSEICSFQPPLASQAVNAILSEQIAAFDAVTADPDWEWARWWKPSAGAISAADPQPETRQPRSLIGCGAVSDWAQKMHQLSATLVAEGLETKQLTAFETDEAFWQAHPAYEDLPVSFY